MLPRYRGFTLVELLVVVTIIIVLLALLMPAMGRAVYQAKLVQCGANQKVVATAAIGYAHENKRFYPNRGLPRDDGTEYYAPAGIRSAQDPTYDLRPMLRDKMGLSVNKNTQCALVEPVDLEENEVNEMLVGNQSLWFGWRYRQGGVEQMPMEKLGDKFEYSGRAYSLLVSDYDMNTPNSKYQSSHPDDRSLMYNWINKRTIFIVPAYTITISLWQSPGWDRGTFDMNFCYEDASVRRYDDVQKHDTGGKTDPRMVRIGSERVDSDGVNRNGYMQVPRE